MQTQCCFTRRVRPAKFWAALALGTFISLSGGWVPQARSQDRLLRFQAGVPEEVQVPQGQFVNAITSATVSRLVVGDPKIATAVPLTDTTFYILGKAEGRTNVAVYGAKDTLLGLIDVEVGGGDVTDLRETIQNVVPQAKVRVETVNGRIRLSGAVPDSIAQRRILEIAEQYSSAPVINAMSVTGGQQVLLEVRVVEAFRDAGRELGISWFARKPSSRIGAVTNGTVNNEGILTPFPLLSGTTPSPFGTMVAQILGGGLTADILVQALEEKGLGRRLAEPNLTALSGEKASFLAGGEVPIPIEGDDKKIVVQFKEYGVRLNFTPTVLDNGTINLKLEPEVSQIDENVVIRAGDIAIPGFITRRASTTIEVRDGQSFAMAGLLQSLHLKDQRQVPWLGQLPVLGTLFRSSSFQEEETDLVIIVTPHLVRPGKPGQPLRTPLDNPKPSNDAEFFLLGNLEVSSDMQRRFIEGTGVVGPYGHIVNLKPEKTNAPKKIAKP